MRKRIISTTFMIIYDSSLQSTQLHSRLHNCCNHIARSQYHLITLRVPNMRYENMRILPYVNGHIYILVNIYYVVILNTRRGYAHERGNKLEY